ncbi:MAG: glycosyltransferase family 2 protein [Patescibacteria group bacterium]|nr:glycosyltransferase family 2 protein [Patescibacteria group bacterium]
MGNKNYLNEKIAIVIPCYNEEKTIGKVISDFKKELPGARIILFDNNCTDNTVKIAKDFSVEVIKEERQGKGYVIQSMFDNIDSEYYIMIDGDDTYPAVEVHKLLQPVIEDKTDMVVGTRLEQATKKTLRPLHQFGNVLILKTINIFFRTNLKDILSGYRVMNKKFIKSIPILTSGFEVETEITLQALERGLRIKEIPIMYRERPDGSESKLRSFRDGSKILYTILSILRDYRPMTFFPLLAGIMILIGFVIGIVIIIEYYQTGFVSRLPSAVLSVSLIILGAITFITGLVVDTINRRFKELQQLNQRNK